MLTFWIKFQIQIWVEKNKNKNTFNPFSMGDMYMRQLFHSLQRYAGTERLKSLVQKMHEIVSSGREIGSN